VVDYTETPISYFQNYFDPLVPLLTRVFDLTENPFRLLGFQTIALLSSVLVTSVLAHRRAALRPFQLVLPVALLSHTAIITTARADYHTSAIGISLLLGGTYAFFLRHDRAAFALLVLGCLTKISFWPSWIMFSLIHGAAKRWRWMAVYLIVGVSALLAYQSLGRFHEGGSSVFFKSLGETPGEVLYNAVFHPDIWWTLASDPERLSFFGQLAAPLGFIGLLYPPALLPTLPLAAFSILDATGYRTMVANTYAVEYLGFFVAAALLGLARSPRLHGAGDRVEQRRVLPNGGVQQVRDCRRNRPDDLASVVEPGPWQAGHVLVRRTEGLGRSPLQQR
jgi:uncharacterized membrane protein